MEDEELWSVKPGSNWILLSLWAVSALIIWSSIIALVGVQMTIHMGGTEISSFMNVNDLMQEGISPVPAWLAVSLLATGAKLSSPLSFLGLDQASGIVHLTIIFLVMLFVGWLANNASRDPRSALYLVIPHGVIIWLLALIMILGGGGEAHIGLIGLDAAWRYMLIALVAGIVLLFASGSSVIDPSEGGALRNLLSRAVVGSSNGMVARLEDSDLTVEEIAERNVWRGAVGGQAHIHCRACGKRLSVWSGEAFCIRCGHPKGIPDSERSCFGCGTGVGSSDNFCFKCGIDLNLEGFISQDERKLPSKLRFCHWCGRELKSGTEWNCPWPDCGQPLARSPDRAICPSCRQLGVYPRNPSPQHCVFCGSLYVSPSENASPEGQDDSEEKR